MAVGSAGLIVGVAAEVATSELRDVRVWLPDLAVGTIFLAIGADAASRRRSGGWLLVATGMTWFIGTYWSSWLFLHRGPLAHAAVTFPGWRPRTWLERAAVVGAYVAAIASWPWRDDGISIVLSIALVIVAAARRRAGWGRAARDRSFALGAAGVFATAVAAGGLVRLEKLLADPVEPMLLAYQLALVGSALLLGAGLRRPPSDAVADLVIELGEARTETLRGALRATLGDPTLEVGYWTGTGTYVDATGHPVSLPAAGDRAATFVEKDSQPFAVLVHDASVLDDPVLADAVRSTTRLTAANAALQAEVRTQVLELIASRRRLLVAGDEERRRLSLRLDERVHGPLTDLTRRLGVMPRAGAGSRDHLLRADSLLAETLDDLDRLAQGLHPRDLERGFRAAMQALVARCPVPTGAMIGVVDPVPPDVATTAYFVVAEALANVTKHSHASGAHVTVTATDDGTHINVVVVDDGRGGADASGGTGLQRLVDRVHALGGMLDVASPPGGGTRLTVELPLDREPR